MEWSRHAEFSEVISYSLFTSLQTLQETHRCLDVLLICIIIPRSTHFVNHLIQAFLNYAPDSICPRLGNSHSKPGKVMGKLRQLVTQPPVEQ